MRYGLHGHIYRGSAQQRTYTLLVDVMLFFAALLAGFIHHDDEQDQPDCNICAVAHQHTADTALHPPAALRLPTVFPTAFTPITQEALTARIVQLPRDR